MGHSSRQTSTGNIGVAIYYRPPDEEEVDAAFFKPLKKASRSKALVLMGDSIHPNICWKDNTAVVKQSKRFLECTDNNFLTQAD